MHYPPFAMKVKLSRKQEFPQNFSALPAKGQLHL